jgi:hypothetical protein
MPAGRTLVLAVAAIAAALCAATSVAYFVGVGLDEPVGAWLGTLALLGALPLGAAGVWQLRTEGVARGLLLVLATGLAGGYTAANALALIVADADLDADLPGLPIGLHRAGLVVGDALYLAALAEATLVFLARHPDGSDAGEGTAPPL